MAHQTPRQRAANLKFAKANEKKLGKPKETKKADYPVSKTWMFVLLFLLIGGGVLELISMLF
ncbi:HDR041Wp [Eremothecium sinecaudum]|uniref:Stress-associated endoplasmic reticulum protein n=1 Tax=Eremothecium sinecaudum TaxID=45286 RepID=A0A0X8HSV4_9SACH|nr:HDR041Wp [Eremothecium sinecaudum]AMD20783.1 HDR041Wp [Eremothecium sinecaudum]